MGAPRWSAEDEFIVRKLYPRTSNEELAEIIGRAPRNVGQFARKLGLKKSPTYIERARPGRFEKGQTPANKGVKRGRGWAPGRMAAGQFRKGEPPHNQNPVGHTRVTREGILEVKVRDTRCTRHDYEAAHRLVWEREHGPIPPGYIVVFKPGTHTTDFRAIEAEHLECISRAENMRRNSYLTRYPKEVADVIRLRGALNRKINNRSKRHAQQAQ